MKKYLLSGLIILGMVSATSCSNEDGPAQTSAEGGLAIKVGLDNSVVSAEESRAEYSDITVDDLTLRLVDADGQVVKEGPAADFSEADKFKIGDYTLEAYYGTTEEDGFEMPYFYGSQELSISENELTPVSLTASLANSLVTICYTDAFKSYFSQYSASVLSSASRTTVFASDETRPAYIATGDTKVFVDVTKPNGVSATLQPAEFTAAAKHRYKVTLDVNEGNVGAPVLIVSFDETLALEPVEIELSDELMNAPAPTVTFSGATLNAQGEAVVEVIEGMPFSDELAMSIVARGGIGSVPMVTSSKDLASAGWPADTDLVKADASVQAVLSQCGLSVLGLWRNPDKMAVVDFSKVAASLRYVVGASNENRFTLYVKDRYGKVCDPVTLVINVNRATLELTNGFSREGNDYLTVDLSYNGPATPSLNDNVTLQVKNTRGTWSNASYTYTAARALDVPVYHLTVTLPADAQRGTDGYELRALNGSNAVASSIVVTVSPSEFAVATSPEGSWATHAYINFTSSTVEYTAEQIAASATVMVKKADDNAYSAAAVEKTSGSSVVKITGLTPGTTYNVKAYITDNPSRDCPAATLTTENATQLPDSGMDSWSIDDSANNWQNYRVGEGTWGTNNPMTTSQGSDVAYARSSGTIPTDDGHSGQGALLRTVGWGSGNTAAGSLSTRKMKYADAGLLHLGSSRTARPTGFGSVEGALTTTDLNCGLAFASRPLSLSFWYKYSPKHADDRGYAEITVLDASGNTLATKVETLAAASAYTHATLLLPYPSGLCAKAAKVYVKFLSTNDGKYLAKNNEYITPPVFGGDLGKAMYLGSQLYIDDLQLNY